MSRNVGGKLPIYAAYNPRRVNISFTKRRTSDITKVRCTLYLSVVHLTTLSATKWEYIATNDPIKVNELHRNRSGVV